jgi:hypothetical protein
MSASHPIRSQEFEQRHDPRGARQAPVDSVVCLDAIEHCCNFRVAIACRIREIAQVRFVSHEDIRIIPTDDLAEEPWRNVRHCVEPVPLREFEVPWSIIHFEGVVSVLSG